MDAKDIASNIESDFPTQVQALNVMFFKDLQKAQVLIDLGEYSDDQPDRMVSDKIHVEILGELLGLPKESVDCQKLSIEDLMAMSAHSGKMEFGSTFFTSLIPNIIPVKRRLSEYISQLRNIIIQKQ
jgi:hypothetical protein